MGKIDEYKIYEMHPDDKTLRRDLSILKRRDDQMMKAQEQEMGQGGPIANFGQQLSQGLATVGRRFNTNFARPVQQTYQNVAGKVRDIAGKVRGRVVSGDTTRGSLPPEFKNLGTVTTQFGGNTRSEAFHPALDIANKEGTPIPEFKGGTVIGVGTGKGYGNYVQVRDPQGNVQRYSHLKQAMVTPGQQVVKGQTIGLMGRTGNVYSRFGGDPSHLDYEVTSAYQQLINPYSYWRT